MATSAQERTAQSDVEVATKPPQPDRTSYPWHQVLFTLAGLLLALLFSSLDGFIVGTAMPRIIGDLHGFDRYTWVTTGYMLAATVMIPIHGKLSDLIGRKVIFLTCLVIFLLGSALCGMAQTMDQLVLFRTFQGLGAGGIMPVAMASFADLLSPKQRTRMQGGFMSVVAVSSILGPILGGWITDHASWHWIFYINLPVGLIALLSLAVLMPPLRHTDARPRIDMAGSLLLIAGVVPILLGLSWNGSLYPSFSRQILALLGGGLAMMALFSAHEIRLERRGGEPIIAPSLFANRAFSISLLTIMVASMGMVGSLAFLPLYAQGVLRISATNSGLVLTPMLLALMASSMVCGTLAQRSGAYRGTAIAGLAISVAGGALMLRLNLQTGYGDMLMAIIALGLGLGCCFAIFGPVIMNALPAHKRGQGMASFDFFQEMGGPIALAILGPVLAVRYAPAYHAALPAAIKSGVPRLVHVFDKPDILLNPTALHALTAQFAAHGKALLAGVLDAVRIGLSQSIHAVFLGGFAILVVGFVVVLFLPHIEMPDVAGSSADRREAAGEAAALAPDAEARSA